MNTRFDGRLWIGALGVTFKVKEMETELVEYVKGTTLFNTMLAELDARGVNTENIMQLYTKDEAFRN